ncbi:MAG: phosphatase PAP2 family protein [Bryobacteraceae bacterium]
MAALTNLTFWAVVWVDTRDQQLMRKVNHWRAPKWMRLWMIAATRCGDGWLWLSLALLVVLFGGEHRMEALTAAVSAGAVGVAVFMKLKRMIGRKRPCALEPHCWAELLPPDQFSFPSGHTITAFSVTVALSVFYPEIQAPLYFCAGSIAASRILLGMHFLSDVIAGAFIGALLGFASATLLA